MKSWNHLAVETRICMVLLAVYTAFALIPEVFFNWSYNYFLFLPWWGVVGCILVSLGVQFFPMFKTSRIRIALASCLAFGLWVCFIVFRTHVHCFGGDGAVGTISPDVAAITLSSFKPNLPWEGRLDTYGMNIVTALGWRLGLLQRMPGMMVAAASQLYCYFWGAVYLVIAVVFLRKRLSVLPILLSMPFMFNFFGNVDSYPLPLVALLVFFLVACRIMALPKPNLGVAIFFGLFWLFCGWVHPLAGMIGFLPVIVWSRWLRSVWVKSPVTDAGACLLFGFLFFCVIKLGYGKTFFSAPFNAVPPIFSSATVIHMLNVCILPILPLALFVLRGDAPKSDKRMNLVILGGQLVCFSAAHFTQGANDQFPYMLTFACIALPWLVTAFRYPLIPSAVKAIVALHVLLLVPMVWVHSTSELTVARACFLYPKDDCKHNKEMSWQTHLGLVLGDCLEDIPAVRKAVLRTFENGARQAQPPQFRGGNYISWVAFHYNYGEFAKGKMLLGDLLRKNPQAVRNFLSTRPGFIYMNRERLLDDLCACYPIEREKEVLRKIVDDLKKKCEHEVYCTIYPSYAKGRW